MYITPPIGLGSNPLRQQTPATFHHSYPLNSEGIAPNSSTDDIQSQAKESPQQTLNHQILASLNSYLKTNGASPIQALDPGDFTPEKVSERILGFVGTAINAARANGADEEKLQEMMAQAREGIEKGFNEAREILTGLGVFEGKIKDNADRTYDLIQQGLDRLEGKPPEEAQRTEALAVASSSHNERSFALEIRTQDGDLITLTMESMRSSSQSASLEQNADGFRFTSTHETQARDSIQFSVEGNLDKDERKALNELIKKVDHFADKFFDGGVPNLLHHASKLGFDSEEIAGFSLSLSQVETHQASVAYRDIEQLGNNDDTADKIEREMPALADFMRGFANLLAQFRSSALTAEPDKTLHDLFKHRLSMDERMEQLGQKREVSGEDDRSMALDETDELMQIAETML